jgi:hypothetical protein
MVLRQWPPTIMPDIQKMVAACQAHPDALVIGWRPPALLTGWHRRWIGRRWPRFWLKMQTGRHLRDPLCALRIYPLAVIENLRLYQRGAMLGAEILVKSAWAGVPFHEVAVDTAMAVHHGEPSSSGEPVWRFLLNDCFPDKLGGYRNMLPLTVSRPGQVRFAFAQQEARRRRLHSPLNMISPKRFMPAPPSEPAS